MVADPKELPIWFDRWRAVEEAELVVDGVRVFYRRVPGEGTRRLLPRQSNPGEDGCRSWRGAGDRHRHAGLGPLGQPRPARIRLLDAGLAGFLEGCSNSWGSRGITWWSTTGDPGSDRRSAAARAGRALVMINAVPLLPGYRWHWVAQVWRRRPLGELANATTTRFSLLGVDPAAGARRSQWRCHPSSSTRSGVYWNKGTQPGRPLALPPRRPRSPGCRRQGSQPRSPARTLIPKGDRDPYFPAKFGEAYAQALPNAQLQVLSRRRPLALD